MFSNSLFTYQHSSSFHLLITLFLFCNIPDPSSSARPIPATCLSPSQTTTTDTWHEFQNFLDADKGSCITGISNLKKYLHQFGYLPKEFHNNFTDVFDETLESALIRYQSKQGLPMTGNLDSITLTHIRQPRCGVSDTATRLFHTTNHFAYFPGKPRWARPTNPMNLTYAFSNDNMISYLSLTDIKAIFQRAFVRWASVIPVSFTEIEEYGAANIKIGFYSGDHGDGEPFDGVLGVLAHSFSPESGMFHLDAAETWAIDFGSEKSKVAVDLESVATHEIGHLLGMAHTSVKEAVMYANLSPRTKKVDLKLDDVAGVQALYGSNPNFSYNSLIESDTSSSSEAVGLTSKMSIKWISFILGFRLLFLCI